jgi:hypothetical protein
MVTIDVECPTQSSPQNLIDRIWSGLEWSSDRSGIKGLAIEYDDGRHQSVQLCVDWQRKYTSLSLMRFRDSLSRISFFYSRLPPGFIRQSGTWEAHTYDGCTHLRLTRSLQLECGELESILRFRAREDAYAAFLEERLTLSVQAIAKLPV